MFSFIQLCEVSSLTASPLECANLTSRKWETYIWEPTADGQLQFEFFAAGLQSAASGQPAASLKLTFQYFTQNTTIITLANESSSALASTLKWTVSIFNWQFSTSIDTDLLLELDASFSALYPVVSLFDLEDSKSNSNMSKFGWSNRATTITLELPQQVLVDDVLVTLSPQAFTRHNNSLSILLPRFTNMVTFDPTVAVLLNTDVYNNTGGTPVLLIVLLSVLIPTATVVLAIIAAILFLVAMKKWLANRATHEAVNWSPEHI
jgi:hypothetical protein